PEWDHHEVPRWKRTERELLVFLADAKPVNLGARWWGEKAALYELTPRNGYGSVIELTAPAKLGTNLAHLGKVYTLDLQEPTAPKKFLQSPRHAIPGKEKAKPLREPPRVGPGGGATFPGRVPFNELLERQARRWVVSDDPTLREEGARALK